MLRGSMRRVKTHVQVRRARFAQTCAASAIAATSPRLFHRSGEARPSWPPGVRFGRQAFLCMTNAPMA